MVFEKDRWEGVTAFFDAVRTPFVIVIIAILCVRPSILTDFIERAGFKVDAVELAGFKLVAKESSANLDATAAKLSQVTAVLADRNKLLGDIAGKVNDPELKQKISEVLKSSEETVQTGQQAANFATQQANIAQSNLQVLAPSVPTADVPGNSLFVFGTDTDVASALDEVAKAQQALAGSSATVALFKKGNFYRSVAIFPDEASRNQGSAEIEAAVRRKGTPTSLRTWCPGATRLADAVSGSKRAPQYQC